MRWCGTTTCLSHCKPCSSGSGGSIINHLERCHPLTLPPQNLKTIFHVKKLLPRVIIHLDGFVWICQRESEWNRSDGSLFNNSPPSRTIQSALFGYGPLGVRAVRNVGQLTHTHCRTLLFAKQRRRTLQ